MYILHSYGNGCIDDRSGYLLSPFLWCLVGRELKYTISRGRTLLSSKGDRFQSLCGHYSFKFAAESWRLLSWLESRHGAVKVNDDSRYGTENVNDDSPDARLPNSRCESAPPNAQTRRFSAPEHDFRSTDEAPISRML